jgi:hypothetical protein
MKGRVVCALWSPRRKDRKRVGLSQWAPKVEGKGVVRRVEGKMGRGGMAGRMDGSGVGEVKGEVVEVFKRAEVGAMLDGYEMTRVDGAVRVPTGALLVGAVSQFARHPVRFTRCSAKG